MSTSNPAESKGRAKEDVAKQPRMFALAAVLGKQQRIVEKDWAERYGVHVRTIRRDCEELRDRHLLPLTRDGNGVWSCTGKVVPITGDLLSEADRFGLLLSHQALDGFAGTPAYVRLRAVHDKLLSLLTPERLTGIARVAEKIRFVGQHVKPIDGDIWQTIMDALETNETISIRYRTGRAALGTPALMRKVDPYGVIVRNREWNLLAWCHQAREVRTFLFGRIEAAESTDQAFSVRDGFNLDTYLSTAVDGHQSAGPLEKVRLRLSPDAPTSCVEHVWCPNQRVNKQPDGSHLVEFETAALFAVKREVLGWGGVVEVVGPESLRTSVQLEARQVFGLNSSC